MNAEEEFFLSEETMKTVSSNDPIVNQTLASGLSNGIESSGEFSWPALFDPIWQPLLAPSNSVPIAQDDHCSIHSGQTLSIAAPGLLANDNDPDGDPLSITLV
ncbi:MAG TPA: Ig-like domain-containing protein, partial [Accumulibacter sp.]|nr:Ig-like domain-containing protein [Accumulibacter sp.]